MWLHNVFLAKVKTLKKPRLERGKLTASCRTGQFRKSCRGEPGMEVERTDDGSEPPVEKSVENSDF